MGVGQEGGLYQNESGHCGAEQSGGDELVIQESPSSLQWPDKYLLLLRDLLQDTPGIHNPGFCPGGQTKLQGFSAEDPALRRAGGRVIPADRNAGQKSALSTTPFSFYFLN